MRFASVLFAFAICLVVCAAMSDRAAAQELAYRDADGNWRWTEASGAPALVSKGVGSDPVIAGVFTVTYEDVLEGTGVGFDSPTSGSTRRRTLHEVLAYLSSILDVPGTADLIVLESQTDGRLALAAAGPFLRPRIGFQGGLVFEHLTTGVDPSDELFDGTVAVDFGFVWNSDADTTSALEFDLYTALLHEVTHALGFFSVVGEDGRSQLLNVDGSGLFSVMDSFLLRASTDRFLFLQGGEINTISEDLESRDLLFDGPLASVAFGSPPPVFAPRPFIDGSSIAHWDPSVGPDAVMLPVLQRGDERRLLTVWELQMLADLGYPLAPCVDPLEGASSCASPDVPDEPTEPNGVVGGELPPAPLPEASDPPPTDSEPPDEFPELTSVAPVSSGGCSASGLRHGGRLAIWILGGLLWWRRRY